MNKLLTAVLLLALTSGVSAQTAPVKKHTAAPAKKAAVKKPAVKTSTGTAANVEVSTKAAAAAAPKPDPAAAIVEKLKAWDAKLETLKADFTQEVNFKEAGLKQSVEGSLQYVKPNYLRIEHLKPARQLVVTDKNDIWIYKADDKQVVRTTWEAWRRTQDQNFSGILDFGNYASLAEKNAVTVEGEKNGVVTVVFTPRTGTGYTLKLRLSTTDYFPVEAELNVEDTVITTHLINTEKNGSIDKAVFNFKPPSGVEILELKN